MHVIYDSDDYCVVEFLASSKNPGMKGSFALESGGYEIVAKHLQRELFINGAMAVQFRQCVQQLISQQHDVEEVDDFLGGFDNLMDQAVILH